MEEVEIQYSGNDARIFKKIENIFPKTMRSVKKIVIFSLKSEQTSYLRKILPKNISYDLEIRDYSKITTKYLITRLNL